ncbi:hypothetical protein V1523DRAFT_414662 [Lipomyces doorenjongii]
MRMVSLTLFSILLFITGYVSHKFRIFQIINEFFLFLWQEGILVRFVKAFSGLTLVLLAIFIPVWKIAIREAERVWVLHILVHCFRVTW